MKRYALCCLLLSTVTPAVHGHYAPESLSNERFVDPRIGTAQSIIPSAGLFGKNTEVLGQCLPAVLTPNGMNFWTPQTRDTEKKCVAPYYYTDSLFQGFRNSHWIVGGCTQDYGSMTIMPITGKLKTLPSSRASRFRHDSEESSPSCYGVYLDDYEIKAEMTGASRSAIFRFSFLSSSDAWILVNPNSDEGSGSIEIDIENRRITGSNPVHRIYQGWGEPAGFSGHFVVEWPKDLEIIGFGTFQGDSIREDSSSISDKVNIGAFIHFKANKGDIVVMKAASSFTSVENAIANLEAEIPHFDFDKTRHELAGVWKERLNLINVEGDSNSDLTKFYSALYRASFLPRTFNDVDGAFPGFAATPTDRVATGHNYYDDFSMWDTYRALHPLLNIIDPKRNADMMQSLVTKYRHGGWLPIFPCWNSYTSAMIGDHCTAAIADAWIKGVRDFDIDSAYEAMRKNAFRTPESQDEYANGMGRRALDSYLKYGFIPLEDQVNEAFHKREQVSRTMEYAFDDFALLQVAKDLGKLEDIEMLTSRSSNWKNIIDPATGYAQGRYADGSFINEPDNILSFTPFITEGAPCHYTWYVPHDQFGLMDAMGGREIYAARLDAMFSQHAYWHGNEPCHQIAWLFNYAGMPWKTQREVRHIIDSDYLPVPGGLSGNDDAGQMSAWLIFACMGFYPVCPASPYYLLGSPLFPKMEISLAEGKVFSIIAHNLSPENIYIHRALLNGKPYNRNFISHNDILEGKTLELFMSPIPNTEWGSSELDLPPF